MTPTPWLLILVILVLLGCSTAPAIPTPTLEPVPRRVSFDITYVTFKDELSQPEMGDFQWLEGASISELGVTPSGATTTLTEIELTERRRLWARPGTTNCRFTFGRDRTLTRKTLCDQAFDVAISPGRVATGVFVMVWFTLTNVSDSTLWVIMTDFSLLDENMVSTEVSLESTERYAKASLINYSEDWTRDYPVIKFRGDPSKGGQDTFMVFEDLEVSAFGNRKIIAVFDIPRTGLERKLKLRFRDGPPVDLVVGE